MDKLEVIREIDRLVGLKDEWDALCRKQPGYYCSQTFGWALESWRAVAEPQERQLLCVVGRQEGQLTLIWPFVSLRHYGLTAARPLGPEAAEYTQALLGGHGDPVARLEAAMDAVRRASHCDLLYLPQVLDHSPEAAAIQRFPRRMDRLHHSWVSRADVANWDSYFEAVASPRHRRDFRRQRRRLSELGRLEFERVEDPSRLREVIAWVVDEKQACLQRKQKDSPWITSQRYATFLQSLAERKDTVGGLTVFALRLSGRVIAAEIGMLDPARFEAMIFANDDDYSQYSPGRMLMEECVKWALDRGLDFDLRVG